MEIFAVIRGSLTIERGPATRPRIYPRRFHESYRTRRRRRMVPRFVSRNGFRPFIWNCGAALSRRASRASWSGRLLDDASDQYRRPASHWPLLLGAVENRPGDDGQEEAGGCLRQGEGGGGDGGRGRDGGTVLRGRTERTFLPPSFHSLQPFFATAFHPPTPPPPFPPLLFCPSLISHRIFVSRIPLSFPISLSIFPSRGQ